MREILRSVQFKRDVRLAERRGKEMTKLRELILLLAEGAPLPPRYKDHPRAASGSSTATATSNLIGFCFIKSTATNFTWFAPEPTLICSEPSL
jgi:hypothetical protein